MRRFKFSAIWNARQSGCRSALAETMNSKKSSLFLLFFQSILIISYVFLAKYDREADPKLLKPKTHVADTYPMFQDIHVMIFVGFGFLMTFLKKYGFGSCGFNFLLSATMVQWGLLCEGLITKGTVKIGLTSLIEADVLVAAILISMGAVVGKTTPLQLVIMGIIEAAVYSGNELLQRNFEIVDVGGSILVHVFGAYFGLAVSKVLGKPKNTEQEGSSYVSDLFAMIGTLFLWLFWPSFNGALAKDDGQRRAIINTYLSISASTLTAFAISSLSHKEKKFDMVHIQNATLAGGVAIGAAADLMVQPYGALIVGSLAGILSTVGYVYLQPFLDAKIGLHDTCGVHNLHGMPGVFAGLVSVATAALASFETYGSSLYILFPARAPPISPPLTQLQETNIAIIPGDDRTALNQALFQLAALALTLLVSIVAGASTGLLLRIISPWTGRVDNDDCFNDKQHWHIPELAGLSDEDKPPEGENLGQVNNAFM